MELTQSVIWPIVACILALTLFFWAARLRKKDSTYSKFFVALGIISLLCVPFLLTENLMIEDGRIIYSRGFGPLSEKRIINFSDYGHASIELHRDSDGDPYVVWIFEKPSGEQTKFSGGLFTEQSALLITELRSQKVTVHDRR